jgi:hypothetical protein
MNHPSLSITQVAQDGAIENGIALCFFSTAGLIALQGLQTFSQLLLKFLWSNEGKAILGSSMFYPTVAMTVLFLVAQVVPNRVVSVCTGFCKRKALAAWKRIKKTLLKYERLFVQLQAKRARIMASMRILIGALEILCL